MYRGLPGAVPCLALVVTAAVLSCARSGHKPVQTLTVVYSNDLVGEVRSCGCIAKDLGGLGRRATLVETVRDSTTNLLLVDTGDMFGEGINYGREKADITLQSMALMRYDAVVPGEKDFGFGVEYLQERTAEVGLPVLAANVLYAASGEPVFPGSRVVEYPSGLRVGLVGIVNPKLKMPVQVESGLLRMTDPVAVVRREVEKLRPEVDVVVVLAHDSRGSAIKLVEKVPGVDLVFHGHEGRPMRSVKPFGNAYVLQVPAKGLYVGLAFAALGEDGRIGTLSAANVGLSRRFVEHESIAKLFRAYDMNVAAKEKSALAGALELSKLGSKKDFVGGGDCNECHETASQAWRDSKHSRAFDILVEQSRQYDKDCIPCHSTGFYHLGGFANVDSTPQLVNVGCEACHGNAGVHAKGGAAPGADARKACDGCHTPGHSPDFDFDAYWSKIAH